MVVGEPAENPREISDGRMTNNLQRVIVPESGPPEGLAAEKKGQRPGRTRIDLAHYLNILHALRPKMDNLGIEWIENIPFN
jgi:hypothetical protein